MRRFRLEQEKGAELLEFAFVLPLLLLICLGTIEFGRAYYTYNILAKSLRDGARYAATSTTSSTGTLDSNAVTNTKNLVVYGNIAGSGSKIISDLQTSQINVVQNLVTATEQYTTVSAAYAYSPLFSLIIPSSLTLRPSVKMHFIGKITFPP
jgi:Flp pilus assembly protein TadG